MLSIGKNVVRYAASHMLPRIICAPAVGWLGLGELFREGLKRGYYVEIATPVSDIATYDSLDSNSQQLVEIISRYPRCIRDECQVHQLDSASGDAALLSDIASHLQYLRNYFSKHQPRLALIAQGYDAASGTLKSVATEFDVPVLAVENTALKDRFLWDCVSGITTNRNMAKNFYWRHEDLISPSVYRDYCDSLIAQTKSRKQAEHVTPETAAKLPFGDGFVLFLGQVYTDSSVLFGLSNWDSPEHVIKELLRNAASRRLNVVLKLHPKEVIGKSPFTNQPYTKLTYRKLMADPEIQTLLDNNPQVCVDHDNEFDTYDLINRARCAVTITSQSGLEAAIRDKPVVVCGDAFFAGLGFTNNAPNPLSLAAALDVACRSPCIEQGDLAKKFAYIFFEKYCRPKDYEYVFRLIKASSLSSHLWSTN